MKRLVGLTIVGVVVTGFMGPAFAKAPNRYFTPFRKIRFSHVDAGTVGVSNVGDADYGTWDLLSHGKKWGHLNFKCERIVAKPKRDLCTAVLRIKGRGQLSVQGIQKGGGDQPRLIVAITGGTQEFRDAAGTITLGFGRVGIHTKLNLK